MDQITTEAQCTFCRIRDGGVAAAWVMDGAHEIAFLDSHPLFLGHVLVIPRDHHPNIFEVSPEASQSLFAATRRMAIAVRDALGCDGVFIASNNSVSQSVDHLHIHVVPRNKKDGLRGFMWPRKKYENDAQANDFANRIKAALASTSDAI